MPNGELLGYNICDQVISTTDLDHKTRGPSVAGNLAAYFNARLQSSFTLQFWVRKGEEFIGPLFKNILPHIYWMFINGNGDILF